MSHQDWTPVVWTKNKEKKRVTGYVNNNPQLKQEENGDKVVKFSNIFIQEVITKRNSHIPKLTQKDLSNKIGISSKDIEWFEKRKMPYNNSLAGKLKRFFDIKMNAKQ